jgi:hypothetical protein
VTTHTSTIANCQRMEELIPKVVDREALDWEVEAVNAHLSSCASCSELRDGLLAVGGLVRRDIAAAVEKADFSGMWAKVEAGMDRVDAKHDSERMKRLLFSWGAVSRWAAVAAVAAAFAWAVMLPPGALHDYGSADNRIEVSSIEGGKDNTVMIYESEEDNVTIIWVIEDERTL